MKPVNSMTTSFVKISNVLEKKGNVDAYRIFESMLSEDERECLKQVEAMATYKKQKPNNNSEPSVTGKKDAERNRSHQKKFFTLREIPPAQVNSGSAIQQAD